MRENCCDKSSQPQTVDILSFWLTFSLACSTTECLPVLECYWQSLSRLFAWCWAKQRFKEALKFVTDIIIIFFWSVNVKIKLAYSLLLFFEGAPQPVQTFFSCIITLFKMIIIS